VLILEIYNTLNFKKIEQFGINDTP
jgi:hypothetical protein